MTPMVTIRAQAMSGVAPRWVMLAPVIGVQRVLERAGWSIEEVDLFELNEAFSVQALGVTRELGIGMERVNVNGGAVAIWASDWSEWGAGAGDADSRDDAAAMRRRGGGVFVWVEGIRWRWRWRDWPSRRRRFVRVLLAARAWAVWRTW